jgi:hypothetical protein
MPRPSCSAGVASSNNPGGACPDLKQRGNHSAAEFAAALNFAKSASALDVLETLAVRVCLKKA